MDKTYALDLAERYMVSLIMGISSQPTPEGMKLAINILDIVDFDYSTRDQYAKTPIWTLMGQDPKEISLSPAQAKFIAQVTVPAAEWNGDFLRMWIPLWERLYPQWEEFVPKPEKSTSQDQGEE